LKRTRPELAAEYAEKIRQAVQAYHAERNSRAIMTGAAKAIAITILLLVLLISIRKVFPWIEKKVISWEGTFIKTISFQSIELMHEKRAVAVIKSGLRLLRTALVLFLLYVYIPLLLSFFVWTEGMADRLFWYIKTPIFKIGNSILTYLPNIFFVLVIVICTYYTTRFTRFFFNEIEQKNINIPGFYPDWAQPSYKIIRFLIIAFAAVMVFPYLPGSDSPAFKGVSVFLGILFSLGSSSAISNAVAGMILTYMRAFDIGDLVKISSTEGYVIEKSLLVTRIRTAKNVDTTIPNAMVLGSHITNYSSSQNLILHTAVTIGYEVPWRQVHELLKDAAARTEGLLNDPPAFVEQSALNEQDVSYVVNAYACSPDGLGGVYSQLHANIQDCFNEAGIEITCPAVTEMRDRNEAAAVPVSGDKPLSELVKVVQ
jgi:small-conductance mechanosensitive channel